MLAGLVALAATLSVCVPSQDVQLSHCLEALGARVPPDQLVEYHVLREETGEVLAYGLDASSGAWYSVRAGGYSGAERDGTLFRVLPRQGDYRETGNLAGERNYVYRYAFSFYRVRQVIKRPEMVTACEEGPDGVIKVAFAVPPDAANAHLGFPGVKYSIWVTPAGWVRAEQRDGQEQADERVLIGEAAPGYPVCAMPEPAIARAVLWGSAKPVPGPGFSMQALAARAFEECREVERINQREKRSGQAVVPAVTPNTPGTVDDPSVARWKYPLVISGVLLLALGSFLWFRNRSS
jgi:hypothetical protein